MQSIYHRWNCWKIVSNNQYIAALGSGVTILNRDTKEVLHHFTRIRCIHGGLFLNEDILVVFTGEQTLYFLQISEKKLLWKCPRPRELAATGDMRCCQIPGMLKVACIACGKQGLNDHYCMIVDFCQQTVRLYRIPNCYRVTNFLNWTQTAGLAFLSYQAKGDGGILYRMIGIDEDATFPVLLEWEASQEVKACSGNYLFVSQLNDENPYLSNPLLKIYKLTKVQQTQKLTLVCAYELTVPVFRIANLIEVHTYLPFFSWIDENAGLCMLYTDRWIGVYDFLNGRLVMESTHNNINCCTLIDGKLLIGCSPGLWICDFAPSMKG